MANLAIFYGKICQFLWKNLAKFRISNGNFLRCQIGVKSHWGQTDLTRLKWMALLKKKLPGPCGPAQAVTSVKKFSWARVDMENTIVLKREGG